MSDSSDILLVGVGGAASKAVRKIVASLDFPVRSVLVDTDASTGRDGGDFVLFGGDRLSGAGSGGDVVQARLAAEDSIAHMDEHLAGVRLAAIVTCLGGGTGAGAALEIVKHLELRGVASVVFATLPFRFEGEERMRNAIGVRSLIEEHSSVTFLLPMDKLAGGDRRMDEAMSSALAVLSAGVSLFWRLVETPGYISMDTARMRKLLSGARRGRFAFASAEGPGRVDSVVAELQSTSLLSAGDSPVRSIFCGILAGDDLRLAEVAQTADALREAFGRVSSFNLATVNDEKNFSGKLEVVAMLLESDDARLDNDADQASKRGKKQQSALSAAPLGRGRFNNVEPTVLNGEDLDVPTYVRRNINLDF